MDTRQQRKVVRTIDEGLSCAKLNVQRAKEEVKRLEDASINLKGIRSIDYVALQALVDKAYQSLRISESYLRQFEELTDNLFQDEP